MNDARIFERDTFLQTLAVLTYVSTELTILRVM